MRLFSLSIAAASLFACAAPGPSSRAKSDAIVRPDELPPRHREVLEAWKKGGAAWELMRDDVRRDPDLARFVVDNLVIEMVQAFDRSRLVQTGRSQGPFERAQTELVELQEHSTALLAQSLALKDGVVGFLSADTLARIGAPAVPEVVKLLSDESVEARRRAAELLGRLPHAGTDEPKVMEALATRAAHDGAWIVRAQAARALGSRGSRAEHKGYALGALLAALADEDASVAESAAMALGELGEPRGIPRLVDALARAAAEGKPGLVEALSKSLAKLSGSRTARDVDGWRTWWAEHAGDFTAPPPARKN